MAGQLGGDGPPVIRIVRKKGHAAHHGGAWKVAYADFMTAMMAFFLVMWIMGLNQPMRQAIETYFKDPAGSRKILDGGEGLLKNGQTTTDSGKLIAPIVSIAPNLGREAGQKARHFEAVQQALLHDLDSSPELRRLRKSVDVHITDDGLRIELMEQTKAPFFDSGSATLKQHTYHLLQVIARQLRATKNPIIIEGHTDCRPLVRHAGYSNWELSTDRANSARRALTTYGVSPGQIVEVRGYADRRPLKPEDPLHFSNRRVSILVAYAKKEAAKTGDR